MLLNKYNKITIAYKSIKTKHDVLKEEKINSLEKFLFLEKEHWFQLERNNVLSWEIEEQRKEVPSTIEIFHPRTKILNEIISKEKSTGDKRGIGYLDASIAPSSGKIDFAKATKVSLSVVTTLYYV